MPTPSYLYTALDWMDYLHRPPPASWVVRAAATFRVLALLLILPCVFLTALDVASYLIVRTLGADSAHRFEPAADKLAAAAAAAAPAQETESEPETETCFATSSAATFALAGEGIFSPPASRAASPRRPDAALRKRG